MGQKASYFVQVIKFAVLNAGILGLLHGQRNSFSLYIHFQDGDNDGLPDRDNFTGIFDKAICQLADMNKTVLMDTNIHKSTKSRNICYNTRHFYPGYKIFYIMDGIIKRKALKLFSGITARACQVLLRYPLSVGSTNCAGVTYRGS